MAADNAELSFEVSYAGVIPAGETVSVEYATVAGTADGSDFVEITTQTLDFVNGGAPQLIVVEVIEDTNIEADENFTLELSNISTANGFVTKFVDGAATNTATGTIQNDDNAGATDGISFANVSVSEPEGNTATDNTELSFEVTYLGTIPPGETVSVDYATTTGTADGSDFVEITTQTLQFTETVKSVLIDVEVLEDTNIESDEDFTVELSNITTANGFVTKFVNGNATNIATGTINDDDGGAGTGLDFSNINIAVDESAGTAIFTVALRGDVPGGFTVDYTTADVTTTSGADYTVTAGTLTFAGTTGETQTITVPITDDTLIESTEGYQVNLSNLSTVVIGINTIQATGIIRDNDSDNDNDGVPDSDDLDDDNDGILDCVESLDSTESGYFAWTLNSPWGTLSMDENPDAAITDWALSATGDYTWSGITADTQGGTQFQVTNIAASSLNEALTNNHYFQVTFTTGADLIDPELYDAAWGWASPEIGDSYSMSLAISEDNFSTYEFLASDVFSTDPGTGVTYEVIDLMEGTSHTLRSNTTYTVRVYIYGYIDDTSNDFSIFDDLHFYIRACQGVDSDNDTILDHLDLDSDNDGLPDNVEAQTTLGYILPDGVFGLNGLDTAFPSGITPTNTDGTDTPDYLDLDSDNEGGDDTAEASITLSSSDIDGDGLDDATDATADYTDVGGTIDSPLTGLVVLPDTDGDVNSGGDVDFRDAINDASVDLDADNDGILDSFEDLNLDGDNDPATDPTNSDSDSYPDYLDIDSDDDGIPDNVEAQTTSGYIAPILQDLNDNGLDDAYEIGGEIGLIPVNTDETDLPDYLDLDSDNDNIPDSIEGNDFNLDGLADVVLIGSDKDNDGLDDSFEGTEQIDIDVNDEVDNPTTNLPNSDRDSELNYRDIDDDNDGIMTVDEDDSRDLIYSNDDWDEDGIPDFLDPDMEVEFDEIEVFNVVTPNGDGVHDFLQISGLEARPNNEIKIFNRWGVLIYATKSYNTIGNVFDGTSQARATYKQGDKLPVGTYFYVLNYEEVNGENISLSGYMYLN
jgi:gliding motility-associated-like protein